MYSQYIKKNPYFLFWIGIIVGAVLTSLLFAYKIYLSDMEASIFKGGSINKIQQQQKKQILPKNYKDSGKSSLLKSKSGKINAGDPSPW